MIAKLLLPSPIWIMAMGVLLFVARGHAALAGGIAIAGDGGDPRRVRRTLAGQD